MKNDPPFWVKADLFVRSLQSKDLQSFSVFLVRARSFSHFLHGFLFDLFYIFMFVLFSVVPRSVWLESCLEICVAQALFVKIFLQMVQDCFAGLVLVCLGVLSPCLAAPWCPGLLQSLRCL